MKRKHVLVMVLTGATVLTACHTPPSTGVALSSLQESHSRQDDCTIYFATQKTLADLQAKVDKYSGQEDALRKQHDQGNPQSDLDPHLYELGYTKIQYEAQQANELIKSAQQMTHSDVQDATLEYARDLFQIVSDGSMVLGFNEDTHVKQRFHERPTGPYGDFNEHHKNVVEHYRTICKK